MAEKFGGRPPAQYIRVWIIPPPPTPSPLPLSQGLNPALLNTPGLRLLLMAYVRSQVNICLRSRKGGRRVNYL